jgi:SPFH domain / Band 7 family
MCFIPQCFTISTSEVGIIERWGKYDRLAKAGCHIICPPMDVLVGTLSFRVQELNVRVESKTLDNVFLTATVSVQYCILAEKVRSCMPLCTFVNRARSSSLMWIWIWVCSLLFRLPRRSMN